MRPIRADRPGVLAISRPLLTPPHDVPGPAHALKPARHAARRFDLADEVDRPHVDAQLQRGRRHDRGELALLQGLFGRPALLQAQAAVMGSERPRSSMARSPDALDRRAASVRCAQSRPDRPR